MRCTGMLKTFAAVVGLAAGLAPAQSAPFMIVGNDEKLLWDDQFKPVLSPPGRDSVLIVDLADPMNPRIVANLALKNSVIGPPVNLDIDPTGTLALVADSVDVIRDGASLKQVPDDKVHVIDLKADPPKAIGMVTVGKQPSGLSINPAGTLALVANREDKSISVLSINGTAVKLIDTVAMGDSVSHATFTPDGKRALATKFPAHQVSLLDVDGDKVTYRKLDLPTGLWPFNVAVAPGGRIALTADSGNAAGSDGSVDTVGVVDLEAAAAHHRSRGGRRRPGGLAISPNGDVAVAVLLAGSNNKPAYFYHRNGSLAVLRIDGKKVTKIGDIEVGGLPEAVAFTPDGRWLLVGNYLDQDFSILWVDGTTITDTGKRFKVPGHPASARVGPR